MIKQTVVVSCPIDTYSGYGARSRDFVKALLKINKYEVRVLSQRWGNCRLGYLEDHNEETLSNIIIPGLTTKPDIWVQITVPNEFQPVGHYNIGVTAGIETTLCHGSWIAGINKMNLILASSVHSKKVLEDSKFEKIDQATNKVLGSIQCQTPIEVLFEGADLTKYFTKNVSAKSTVFETLSDIKESFCYLSVGHWMQGSLGHDRKNIGYTVKSFMEFFKNKSNQPALILKTQSVGSSHIDRDIILKRIHEIRKTVKGRVPNVYVLHGEMTDEEVNDLYNHPKVKVMVSHTKGEGFGRPLLEFSLTGKPIIASGWSGQVDFLPSDKAILLGGKLDKVHPSAVVKNVLLPESSWFFPADNHVNQAYKETFKKYKQYSKKAQSLRASNKKNFSFDKMTETLEKLLGTYIQVQPKQLDIKLPNLQMPKLVKNG